MKCKNCNVSILEDSGKCPTCGKSIEELESLGMLEKQEDALETFDPSEFGLRLKKKSLVLPIIIGIIFLFLVCCGVGSWLYITMLPKLKFEGLINQTVDYMSPNYKGKTVGIDFDFYTDIISGKTDESAIFELINKLNLNGSVEIDYENNISFMKLNALYDKEDLLSSNIFVKNGKGYIKFNDLYDKYISYSVEENNSDNAQELSIEDYNKLKDVLMKSLKKSLKIEYFSMTMEDNVTKSVLKLDEKNVAEISLSILNDIKDDENIVDILAKVIQKDKDELKETIDEQIEENEKTLKKSTFMDLGEISIYTKRFSNEFIKVEVNSEKGGKFSLERESDDDYVVKINTSEGEKYTLNLNLVQNGEKYTIKASLKTDDVSIGFTFSYSIKYDVDIEEPNVVNSVEYSSLSEDDINEIGEKIQKKKGFTKLSEDLMGLYGLFGYGIGDDESLYEAQDSYGI